MPSVLITCSSVKNGFGVIKITLQTRSKDNGKVVKKVLRLGGGGGGGDGNSHILGYRMCHFLRVLLWLENKFLGLFCSL